MLNTKIRNLLWILYIVIYLWVWGVPRRWENSLSFYYKIAAGIIILTGMIGYIIKVKIIHKIIWKIVFLILLFFFPLSLITAIIFDQKGLLMLILFLPALYALYSYAYRSRHIWENKSILQHGNYPPE
jgi:formate/nitrite transporter FocA (FNT family)